MNTAVLIFFTAPSHGKHFRFYPEGTYRETETCHEVEAAHFLDSFPKSQVREIITGDEAWHRYELETASRRTA